MKRARTFVQKRPLLWFPIWCVITAAAAIGAPCHGLAVEPQVSQPVIQFNRDVRPILSDHCFACHGPDAAHREADLRLDTREGLLGDSEVDAAAPVLAGRADASLLWQRISASDVDSKMPPADFAKPLTPEQIEILRKWIDQGAAWEGHWSFAPLAAVLPPVPDEEQPAMVGFRQNAIDDFVLQKMRSQNLRPALQADRRDLIRRLSFDLHGLPPSGNDAMRFIADESETAYEQLVDKLLEAPQFGERMAMWWLDLVRYADSVGYHGDQPVSVSPYRDYVIESFNRNKPFDEFTIEQLAGDLLPEKTLEQQIASGYNRLGMMSAEGGVQPKEYLAKYIAERVRNLGGAWLGVTLGCCECHDHKYDPFTAKDFYSFEAFFADIQEQGLYSGSGRTGQWGSHIQVPTQQQQDSLAALDNQIASVKRILESSTPRLEEAQRVWERQQPQWIVLRPESLTALHGSRLDVLDDGSVLASGPVPSTEIYGLAIADLPPAVTYLRLEVLPHESLPQQGPGRAGNGNFVLSEVLLSYRGDRQAGAQTIRIDSALASYEQTGAAQGNPFKKWAVAAAIDHDSQGAKWGWAVMEKVGQPHWAIFKPQLPIAGGRGSQLFVSLQQLLDNPGHVIGRFRLSATNAAGPISGDNVLPADIAEIVTTSEADRTADQSARLAAHFRSVTPLLQPERDQLSRLEAERVRLDEAITTTLVTVSVSPRPVRVLGRGNWMDETGELVEPAVPSFLPPMSTQPQSRPTRLDLARWVVAKENPLTARVLVNRLWKLMFGAGLSRKLDDLGAQGEPPSHPELLDWLSQRLIESGWDVKQLVKLMVMSGTYRQSSMASAQQNEVDPFNRWLSHQSRFRLEAETIRDNALSISGLLVGKLGGPSVKPYQPAGYWSYLNFPTREWQTDSGEKLYRRGLYTHWQRQYLHPSLLAFDAPSREECAADRNRSNTPLQSLVLLNDPTFVEAARVLAEAALRQGGDSFESRIKWIYTRAASRAPSDQEQMAVRTLLEKHLREYEDDPAAAAALIATGAAPVPSDLPSAELAAWTSVARVILNLHEVIVRY